MSSHSYQDKDDVRKLSDWKSFKILWPYFQMQWRGYVLSFIMLSLSSSCIIWGSKTLGAFVDRVLTQKHWEDQWFYIISFLFLEVCSILLMWFGRNVLSSNATASVLEIRKNLFQHIHELPLKYYDKQPEGRTVTRLTHDVESIEEFFAGSFGRIVSATMTFIFAVSAMVLTFWKLGIVLTISIIPAVYFTFIFKARTRVVMRTMSKHNSACNASLSEYLRGMPVIRSFAINRWVSDRYENILNRYIKSVLVANGFFAWSRPLVAFFTYLPVILLLFIGGQGVFEGWFTVGLMVTYIRYCENFASPISMISREITAIQQSFTAVERIAQFFDEQTEDDVFGRSGPVNKRIEGKIEFRNISMGYEDNIMVLNDICFSINAGEKVGIAGRTGCGKTTVVSLLARLYPYQLGEIYIDDIPLNEWSRESLRSQIGFISQDVTIFQGTLRDNLRVGLEFSDQEIMQACELSRFSFIMQEKAMDFEYWLQEGGSNLSIGEKQLLAFTRVLLSDPAILILDEATANIDERYEAYLQEALVKSSQGRTVLIIAHRLNTLEICDKVLKFEKGHLLSSENIKNTTK